MKRHWRIRWPSSKDFRSPTFHLGGHREEDFREADLVVVNPAVRPGNRFVQIARDAGVPVRCELELFIERLPGENHRRDRLERQIDDGRDDRRDSYVGQVSNLSQIENRYETGWKPVLRNLARRKFRRQSVGKFGGDAAGRLGRFGNQQFSALAFFAGSENAAYRRRHRLHAESSRLARHVRRVCRRQTENASRPIVGRFGRFEHVRCRSGRLEPFRSRPSTSALSVGKTAEKIIPAGRTQSAQCLTGRGSRFGSRLHGRGDRWRDYRSFPACRSGCERIANIDGRLVYNDSAATTPESTIAALKTFDVPVWLLAGGRNKGFDFSSLAASIVRYARGAAFFGSCRGELENAVVARLAEFPCSTHETLAESFDWCLRQSRPGDAIVLSPACASTDQFRNFQHRGEAFREMVSKLRE